VGDVTLAYGSFPWPQSDSILHLAAHVSSIPLLVTALSAVALSLARLIKALGPHVVRLYRARLARLVLQDVHEGKVSAAEGATVINALARLEAAADGRDLAAPDPAGEPPVRGVAAPLRRVKRSPRSEIGPVQESDPSSDTK
jgi:hypothetical protein